MTYSDICARLRAAGVENAEWDAQLLIERACGADGLAILGEPNRDYDGEWLEAAVLKRCAGEPLQYLLGEWEFYRQTYEVTPACLIPRPDTEILVEEAIRLLPEGAFFADLCTGSGCIAISTLAERPDTSALAVDLSAEALEVAKRNAVKNGVASRFFAERDDVLRLSEALLTRYPRPTAILSNPPYIRTEVLQTLSREVLREPRMALDGGEDGLLFYRALLTLASRWLADGGFCLWEIGFDQGDSVSSMADELGFSCSLRRDYGGCDRVAILRRRDI